MALTIPRSTHWTVKRGDRGIPVFSVQRVCNKLEANSVVEDMDFGPKTEAAAKKLQEKLNVEVDGVVGPGTQRALAEYLCALQERKSDLPDKILLSKILYESGGILNAVNWSVAGGVDCGMTQRRVYDEQYGDDSAVKRAFDACYQIDLSGDRVQELYEIFLARPGIDGRRQRAYRTAILNHNYPALADRLSRGWVAGLSSYYTSPQSWVTVHGLRFPDGAPVRTPLEWGQRYALGARKHDEPGQAVKLVKWR